jgi:solute carrier family 38 (sodium-coupled neutral amino acid transporter), member 11
VFGIVIGGLSRSCFSQSCAHYPLGDTIPQVIRSIFPTLYTIPVLSLLTNRQFVISLCTICVSYPLSLYRDIHKLSRASGLALVGMLIIVASVLIESPHVTPELKGDPSQRFTILGPGVFQSIGVISFAFVCHHNSLLIYGSMRTPTLDRFAKVTHVSTLMSLVACCTLAISAYLVFTDKTQGNILNNFSSVCLSFEIRFLRTLIEVSFSMIPSSTSRGSASG